MGKYVYWAFVAGAAAGLMANCMVQDMMGQERYLEYVRAHWVQRPVWKWILAFMVLDYTVGLLAKAAARKGGE